MIEDKEKEIERYLFNELSDTERERFEDRFAAEDELFYEIAARENELVDEYLNGRLGGELLGRFEASLASNPARRQKIANGLVLHEFVAEERAENRTITIAERAGIFSKIGELLSFDSPAFRFASVGAVLLLALVSVFLLIENRRLSSLESELAAARQRESELAARIETADDASSDLANDLAAERDRVRNLEAELARQISVGSNVAPPEIKMPPTIATISLFPILLRDGRPPSPQRVEIPSDVERVSIIAELSAESGDRVSARLNGKVIGQSIRVRSRKGASTVSVIIPVTILSTDRNDLEILDESGAVVERYTFSLAK